MKSYFKKLKDTGGALNARQNNFDVILKTGGSCDPHPDPSELLEGPAKELGQDLLESSVLLDRIIRGTRLPHLLFLMRDPAFTNR